VLGLLAAGLEGHPAVLRGVQYLLEQQAPNGAWEEAQFTGTGFPRVFYLRYHYYAIYFPLMALSRFARSVSPSPVESEDAILPGASQAREVLAAGKPAG